MFAKVEESAVKIELGDPVVFESVFKQYYALLTLFANKYLNDLHLAEEIVSDVFTFLWERRDSLMFTTSLQAYLYRMVQNRCLNFLKHRKIENEYVNYVLRNNLLDQVAEEASSVCFSRELEEQINKAIDTLPVKCKMIFKMSRFKHLKNKEIARILNISPKTVERQITIALEKLRCSLHYLVSVFLFLLLFIW